MVMTAVPEEEIWFESGDVLLSRDMAPMLLTAEAALSDLESRS